MIRAATAGRELSGANGTLRIRHFDFVLEHDPDQLLSLPGRRGADRWDTEGHQHDPDQLVSTSFGQAYPAI